VNPTSIPATSTASPAAGLTGISPAAPPPSSKGYIVRLQVLPGCFCVNQGPGGETTDLSRGFPVKSLLSFCEFQQHFVKSIKNRRKSKNCKLNFVVLSVTRTTTFSKVVYTFELQFLLEK
jgi:hypothetical protein